MNLYKFNYKKTILFFISKKTKNIFISCINITKIYLKVIGVFSCGTFNFYNKKKETIYASILLINKIVLLILKLGFNKSFLIFNGINLKKKIILKTFKKTQYLNKYLDIILIKDITKYPYNGCRQRKIKSI